MCETKHHSNSMILDDQIPGFGQHIVKVPQNFILVYLKPIKARIKRFMMKL